MLNLILFTKSYTAVNIVVSPGFAEADMTSEARFSYDDLNPKHVPLENEGTMQQTCFQCLTLYPVHP